MKRVAAFLVGITLTMAVAGAADLSSAEKQYLAQAKTYLTQFQSNLKMARDTAGPGEDTPPASKAKLAAARLQSAKQSAANVAARLERLPKDHDDVKTLQAGYDEAMKAVTALEDRLTGKNDKPKSDKPDAPAKDGDDAKPQAPAKEERLGYQLQNALKIAQGNVDEVTAYAQALEKTVAELKAVKDPTTISNDTLTAAFSDIMEARRKKGFADNQFKLLPAEHSSVKPVADALKAAVARLDAVEKALEPIRKQTMKQADASSYPELKTDNERLKELRESLAVGNMQVNRAAAAELVKQLPAMKEETARIEKKYAPLLSQNTGESGYLKTNLKQFAYSLERFEEAIAKEKETLPKQFDTDLAQAAKLTEEAVRENKPLFFAGGIASQLRFAEDKLVLYEALDPAGAKMAADRLAKARADVKQKELSLSAAIIAANELPPDRYAGPDKAELTKLATEALKQQRPGVQVLTVRFPSDKWERSVIWRYENSAWRKIDHSKLQAQVITKRDDKVAEIHPINLWANHLKDDAVSALPLFGQKDELGPQSLMSLAKVK